MSADITLGLRLRCQLQSRKKILFGSAHDATPVRALVCLGAACDSTTAQYTPLKAESVGRPNSRTRKTPALQSLRSRRGVRLAGTDARGRHDLNGTPPVDGRNGGNGAESIGICKRGSR